ncbi:MAG: carbohydrate kinase family protein [Candidatus Woesearchaeota archaeon]
MSFNHKFDAKYDIITMGSATVDVFVHTDPEQSEVLNVHHHKDIAYPLGAKILIKEMHTFVGGGGTNSAVAFSRLGLKTAFLGKVGKDVNGKIILDCLSEEKVDFIGVYGNVSGYSVVLDSVIDDRTILAYKGCNDELRPKDISLKSVDTRWLYMSSMMKESFITQQKIVRYASRKGIYIAYNPSLYIVKKGLRSLRNILNKTYILIFNKEEAQTLLKDNTENIYNLLFKISRLGPKIVVITDGKNGAHCYDGRKHGDGTSGMVYSAKPGRVKILETTGAGDAFASGFLTGIILGKDVGTSLKLGMLNSESVISHLGAKNVLLDHKAIKMAEDDNRTIFKKKL